MSHLIAGVFQDNRAAADFVNDIKQDGNKEISIYIKGEEMDDLRSYVINNYAEGTNVKGGVAQVIKSAADGLKDLMKEGFPSDQVKIYQSILKHGDILVAVNVNHNQDLRVRRLIEKYGAIEVSDLPRD